MTARTRRGLMICLVLGLITLPAEMLLLPVAGTPDPKEAAAQFVAAMTPAERTAATAEIDRYPALYRRAIMASLSPADRAEVWRAEFDRFQAAHPELSADQRELLQQARALIVPEAFQPPLAPELQARIQAAFDQITTRLPDDAAKELFVTLGPKEPTNASALPLMQRLGDRIRGWRVTSAQTPDCNCNIDIDTCDIWPEEDWLECSEQYTCEFDLSWPMCGPLWSWACTGWCRVKAWEPY